MSAITNGLRTEVRGQGSGEALGFLWLEITGKCQLECEHCYAESGPGGTHGSMTADDWLAVIDEAAQLGVRMVQFIGGEPTLHPDLPMLIRRALGVGLEVEVFSNLVFVRREVFDLIESNSDRVRLATSYYSDKEEEQEAITRGRRGTAARTRENIVEALRRSIELRVGIIGVRDGQRVDQARAELERLGVPAEQIGLDFLRQVGRGIRADGASVEQLCGNCANGVMAISPTGEVWPCVFSRWLAVGNVREQSLAAILDGEALSSTRAELEAVFAARGVGRCDPYCNPNNPCDPDYTITCRPGPRARSPQLSCRPVCSPNCAPNWEPSRGDADTGPQLRPQSGCVPDNGSGGDPCEPAHPSCDPWSKPEATMTTTGSCKPTDQHCGPCRPSTPPPPPPAA